jgi:RNA-directed DNA polymerase
MRERIRQKTPRNPGRSLREVILRLNPTLKGWYGFFRNSQWTVSTSVDGFVRRRLRSIWRKYSKRKGTARRENNARCPNHIFHNLGLFSLEAQLRKEAGPRGRLAFPATA